MSNTSQSWRGSITETIVQDIAGTLSGAVIYHFIGPVVGLHVSYFQNGTLMVIHFVIGFITGGTIRRIAVHIAKGHQSWFGSWTETIIKYSLNFVRGFLVNDLTAPTLNILMPASGNAAINVITTVFGFFRSLFIRRCFEVGFIATSKELWSRLTNVCRRCRA